MDKSFTKIKRIASYSESVVDCQTRIRFLGNSASLKNTSKPSSVSKIPELLCENDQLRLENQAQRQQLERLKKRLQRETLSLNSNVQGIKQLTFGRNSRISARTQNWQDNFRDHEEIESSLKDELRELNIKPKHSTNNQFGSSRRSEGRNQGVGLKNGAICDLCGEQLAKIRQQNSLLQKEFEDIKQRFRQTAQQRNIKQREIEMAKISISQLRSDHQSIKRSLVQKEELIRQQVQDRQQCSDHPTDCQQCVILSIEKVQREKQIEYILSELKKQCEIAKDYVAVRDCNYQLRNQIAELTLKCAHNYEKSYKFGPIVSHLWQIKEIQFSHLFDLLQQIEGTDVDSDLKSSISQAVESPRENPLRNKTSEVSSNNIDDSV